MPLPTGQNISLQLPVMKTRVMARYATFDSCFYIDSFARSWEQMSGMAGSKRFMAPEVCQGLQYNEKVDVYSFGIVMWEILALRKPFAGMGVADHYREVIVGGLRPPLDPRWPTSLNQLLQSCWHPDPDYRPTILETRESLRQIIENSSAGR